MVDGKWSIADCGLQIAECGKFRNAEAQRRKGAEDERNVKCEIRSILLSCRKSEIRNRIHYPHIFWFFPFFPLCALRALCGESSPRATEGLPKGSPGRNVSRPISPRD